MDFKDMLNGVLYWIHLTRNKDALVNALMNLQQIKDRQFID
jgi:hypothetical protein